jgi:membrane protease YdiL (CAAX protease family)
MPPADQADSTLFSWLNVAVLIWGALIWWKLQFVASSAIYRVNRLPQWPITDQGFVFQAFLAITGGIAGGALASIVVSLLPLSLKTDKAFVTILAGSIFDLSILAGVLGGRRLPHWIQSAPLERSPGNVGAPRLSLGNVPKAGLFTYLAALPIVAALQQGWLFLLEKLQVDAPRQELTDFLKETHGFSKLTLFIVLTVVIGPIVEELIFRAGIFRYLRQRVPPWFAYLCSALLFAGLHTNLSSFVPLIALAYILALSYERSGRIAVPMIAHGLFNLTSVLLLLTGHD